MVTIIRKVALLTIFIHIDLYFLSEKKMVHREGEVNALFTNPSMTLPVSIKYIPNLRA